MDYRDNEEFVLKGVAFTFYLFLFYDLRDVASLEQVTMIEVTH